MISVALLRYPDLGLALSENKQWLSLISSRALPLCIHVYPDS